MADQNNQGSDDVAKLDDAPAVDLLPDNFDEETYLRAFPDVAQAIANGFCDSPLQHYMEHGRHEDRTSDYSYLVLLQGRHIDGHIDFYGHSALAGGWLFCGWSAARWNGVANVRVTAHFRNGKICGHSIAASYQREGLQERGSGAIFFVQGMNEPLGALETVDIKADGELLTILVEPGVRRLPDPDIASSVGPILLAEHDSENCRELLRLLSTSGYGRLHHPFNTLDGFVDLCAYHAASGGWFFCGWVTRSWDLEAGPDKFVVRFADGDFAGGETVAGFFPREDLEGRGVGFIMFVRGAGRPLGSLTSVEVQFGGVSSYIRASSSTQRLREAELTARLRPIIHGLADPNSVTALLAFLSRQPYMGVDTLAALSSRIFLEFDQVIACPPGGIILMGWLLAKPGIVRGFRLRSSSMNEAFDFTGSVKIQRPDVIEGVGAEYGFDDPRCGFIAFVPCCLAAGIELYMEVETAQYEVGYRRLPPAKLEGVAAIKHILNGFEVRYNEVSRAFEHTVGPAIDLINRNRLARRLEVDIIEFGQVNMWPEFSVIIPLYGRLDFIEYQMAFMSGHPAAFDYEYIYVLDDPPKQRDAERLCSAVYARFGIPFRLLILSQNVGFAPANNVGLRAARGRLVCYLNSDVFPGPLDWLERLARHLDDNPDIGTIGPVLLYADGSVQHEGMVFKRLHEFGGWWFPDHPNKGKRKPSSGGLTRHISITGACMLMRREIALQLGGFDESYIIGDFEDTDLCLRMNGLGLTCAVVSDVQLYHLERKSQATSSQAWRMNLTLYNAWVHQTRWARTIESHPLQMPILLERNDT